MSYRTIAAALALDSVTAGERLVAFSLASFADGEHQAFPGDATAAARAGLSRSRYLAARKQLVVRGLVTVAGIGGGRGRLTTLTLDFANSGPWFDGRINPGLFQAVLSYTRARGPARLLLAALGALASEDREVVGFTTEEIRVAAGLADSTTAVRGRRCCPPARWSSTVAPVAAGTPTSGGSSTPTRSGRLCLSVRASRPPLGRDR